MAALKKAVEIATESRPQSKPSPRRIALATPESEPVDSAAHQLRLHLEAALARPGQAAAAQAEPVVEKWPGPVRTAILAGAVILPWSLIALTAHAMIGRRLF